MADESQTLPFLNIFEVADPDGTAHHIVAFVEPVRAGSEGIPTRSVAGDFTPGPGGAFDAATFRPNPAFIEAFTAYMNEEAGRSPALIEQARGLESGWLYVLDPRADVGPDEDLPSGELLGAFAVDDSGQIAPRSFQYNREHLLFHPESGPSGLFRERRFYDWLHAPAAGE
ncbi:hypothetical protein TA3x_000621 [Tundrisphaera sp. TA3]|uniref:hypothetical protein n=1 Tax=Tundrisphaera sp. TA3 TaxID=3435775 RepID=UPI003EBBFB0F